MKKHLLIRMLSFGMMLTLWSMANHTQAQIYQYLGGGVVIGGPGSNTPTSVATHVTGSNLTPNGSSNAIGTVCGYTTSGYNRANRFVWFSVKPDAGYQLNVTSLTARVRVLPLSPIKAKFGYSTDGGSTWTDGAEITPPNDCSQTKTLDINLTITGGKELRIRFLGYGALTATGTMDVSNITLNGTVTCDASIAASISPTSTRICDEASKDFNASVISSVAGTTLPTFSHSWTKTAGTGDGTLSSPTTNSSITLTGSTPGDLTVGYSASWDGGTCSVSATSSEVTIVPLPEIASSSNSPVCEGSTLNLSASGGNEYSWSGPSFSSTDKNPSLSSATLAMAGTYSVTVTNTGECPATVTNTIPVTVYPLPVVSVGSNSPVCERGTIQLNASGGAFYSWAKTNFSSTLSNPTLSNATTSMGGVYSVTVTATGNCPITVSNTVSVVVSARNALPTITSLRVNGQVPNAQNRVQVNAGSNINFSVTAINTVNYSWVSGTGFSSTMQNPSITLAGPANAGQYVVVARNGCTFFAARTVNVVILNPTRMAAESVDDDAEQIIVAPNPVSSFSRVKVQLTEASPLVLKILRAGDGQVLESIDSQESLTQHEFEVNMTSKTPGMYFFVAETRTKVISRKVIKAPQE